MRWFHISDNIRIHLDQAGKVAEANVHPSRLMDEWVFVLITSGQRTFCLEDEPYVIPAKNYFLLPPDIPHSGMELDQHQAYYMHFKAGSREVPPPTRIVTGEILLPLYGPIPLDLPCLGIMEYAIRHHTSPFNSDAFAISQIKAILYQLSIEMQRGLLWTKQDDITANAIMKYIDEHLHQKINAQDYETAFGKSYRQLNNVFSRVYGMTIKQMQHNLRIDRAKTMLSMGDSITRVSAACGFEDYLYFLKTFKSSTGLSPSEYVAQFNFTDNGGEKVDEYS